MASLAIELPVDKLEAFCQRRRIIELFVFGSVLRDDFRSDSDLDVLVDFVPDIRVSLFDLADMEIELESLLGRRVDLVVKRGVEESDNWIIRKAILNSAIPIYVAR